MIELYVELAVVDESVKDGLKCWKVAEAIANPALNQNMTNCGMVVLRCKANPKRHSVVSNFMFYFSGFWCVLSLLVGYVIVGVIVFALAILYFVCKVMEALDSRANSSRRSSTSSSSS